MFMKKTIGLLTAGCAIASFFIAGCSKNNGSDVNIPTAALSSYNLAPDNLGATFILSGNILPGSPLSYPSYTSYTDIYTGTRDLQVLNNYSGSVLSTVSNTYDTSKYYSAFFMGANNAYSSIVVRDNYDSLSASTGKAYVRFVQAVPDSSQPKVTIGSTDSTSTFNNVKYGYVSQFIPVAPGNIDINANNDSTIQTSRTISVEQAKVYTILIMGLPNATDTVTKVQIRYATNGTLSGSPQQGSSVGGTSFKANPRP